MRQADDPVSEYPAIGRSDCWALISCRIRSAAAARFQIGRAEFWFDPSWRGDKGWRGRAGGFAPAPGKDRGGFQTGDPPLQKRVFYWLLQR